MSVLTVYGQGRVKDSYRKSYDEFVLRAYKDYYDFRRKAIAEYTAFVRRAWTEMGAEPPKEMPKEEVVMPMLVPEADEETNSWFSKLFSKSKDKQKIKKEKKRVDKKNIQLPTNKVIDIPPVVKQPEPEREVKSIPLKAHSYKDFSIFGTKCRVRIGENCVFKLPSVNQNDVADAIDHVFANPYFDNLLHDCLAERKKHNFSDWAYYQMLTKLTDTFYGPKSNEATLVLAFLYSQSGYLMRLARGGDTLYMLAASAYYLWGKSFCYIDGGWFYLLDGRQCSSFEVCRNAKFRNESPLTLQVSALQHFDKNVTPERTIASKLNDDFSFTIQSNKNYMDYYESFPPASINDDFMTKFAIYANTPLEEGLVEQLYPKMKQKLDSLSLLDGVQQILWWVQTGLEYKLDEEIWGRDRAFFGEESLFYPYCDCEDRSILMSHLVRDLLGLDVVLVYYPGHLAMAVNFPNDVEGDYYLHENRKFVVCDPTYIRARVGETMPTMVGLPHTLFLLKRGPKWVNKTIPAGEI